MLFAFVCLSRQQIQPYHPVETLATPCDGVVGSRTPVRSNRLCILLNIVYSILKVFSCQAENRGFEPLVVLPTQTFQVCTISLSDNSPIKQSYHNGNNCQVKQKYTLSIQKLYSFEDLKQPYSEEHVEFC
jgi:hypothetical protein